MYGSPPEEGWSANLNALLRYVYIYVHNYVFMSELLNKFQVGLKTSRLAIPGGGDPAGPIDLQVANNVKDRSPLSPGLSNHSGPLVRRTRPFVSPKERKKPSEAN